METSMASQGVAPAKERYARRLSRGQGLVLFVLSIFALLGFTALVIDVSWYWANTLRVQRAADAAALAGAVYLPGDPATAVSMAAAEATKNGYTASGGAVCGVSKTCITANQDPTNDNRLIVTVAAPVQTYFMRIFGIQTLNATRTAKAEYILPVPMGSPLNYFGVYGTLRTPSGYTAVDTGAQYPTWTLRPKAGYAWNLADTWTQPDNAFLDETPNPALAATIANYTAAQPYTIFNLTFGGSPHLSSGFLFHGGIRIFVRAKSSDPTNCQLRAEITSNASAATPTWTAYTTATKTMTGSYTTLTFGNVSTGASGSAYNDADYWWRTTGWTTANFSNANFAVRVKAVDPDPASNSSCDNAATTYVDWIQAQVDYEIPDPLVDGPSHEYLGPQGSWTGMLSPGSDIVNGDPYLAGKNNGAGSTYYSPNSYYDYAVEMSPTSTNGVVSVFDPVYCATDTTMKYGMGDHWYSGTNSVSSFFDLYDTNNTPYDIGDDQWIAGNWGDPTMGGPGSANPKFGLFRNVKAADASLISSGSMPSGVSISCARGATADPTDGRYWHDRWWTLASGLQAGHVYRIRVQSRDPSDANAQANTDALNNFSFHATADGTLPRVYGLGSMVAFSPLPGGQNTEFYMAQIASVHAGKTMRIQLYDPGDTNTLSANLQILTPTSGDYTPVNFTYSANKVASAGASCNSLHGTNVPSVATSAGSGGYYNGCWLTITIQIPNDYTAPKPATETNANAGGGWWKVRYVMGSGSGTASDLTTWKVNLSGNPVHLIVP